VGDTSGAFKKTVTERSMNDKKPQRALRFLLLTALRRMCLKNDNA
jgi:hypothetical protein